MSQLLKRQIFIVSIRQDLRQQRITLICRQDQTRFTCGPLAFLNNKALMRQLNPEDRERVHFWAGVECALRDATMLLPTDQVSGMIQVLPSGD